MLNYLQDFLLSIIQISLQTFRNYNCQINQNTLTLHSQRNCVCAIFYCVSTVLKMVDHFFFLRTASRPACCVVSRNGFPPFLEAGGPSCCAEIRNGFPPFSENSEPACCAGTSNDFPPFLENDGPACCVGTRNSFPPFLENGGMAHYAEIRNA